jgi:tetratricopeptide (TPR) repeat protein
MRNLTPILKRYKTTLDSEPSSKVFVPYAEGLRSLGHYQDAIKVLKKGIQFHPHHVSAYIVLASLYFDRRLFTEVYETLRPWLETTRDNVKLQKIFAETCLELNRNAEALKTFKYLLYLNPKDSEIQARVFQLEQEEAEEVVIATESSPTLYPLEKISEASLIEESTEGWRDQSINSYGGASFDSSDDFDKKEDSVSMWREGAEEVNELAEESERVESEHFSTLDLLPSKTLAKLYQQQGHTGKAQAIMLQLEEDEKTEEVVGEQVKIETIYYKFLKLVQEKASMMA